MSIKNDLHQIKGAFSNDGQILESAFRFEILFKRYKKVLITLAVVIVVGLVYVLAQGYLKEQKLSKANEAYKQIAGIQEPDEETLKTLKENNPTLYDFYTLTHTPTQETLQELIHSKNDFIAQIATYQSIQNTLNTELETSHQESQDISVLFASFPAVKSKILEQWLLLQESAILLKQGSVKEARNKAMLLDENSDFAQIGKNIRHYQE